MTDKLQRLRELCENADVSYEHEEEFFNSARDFLPLLIEVAEAAKEDRELADCYGTDHGRICDALDTLERAL